LEGIEGIDFILDDITKPKYNLNHRRAGDLIAVANSDAWFTYYYWLNDKNAPDFAKTVDIHRKPGYDPVELLIDPEIKIPKLKIALKLLQKKLGFRYLMDVIPLDASLVRGSHGCLSASGNHGPLFITQNTDLLDSTTIQSTDVCQLILAHLLAHSK
ncbi:MAG: alkaline phosphatase family protein, partial [Calothrix sp. SM1_7_51]|nr:alkaline phosphatase family protein [Calothrix sp. SM1_7_51]